MGNALLLDELEVGSFGLGNGLNISSANFLGSIQQDLLQLGRQAIELGLVHDEGLRKHTDDG